jgi:5-methylcytosine-specific restriction endonuclease McrA
MIKSKEYNRIHYLKYKKYYNKSSSEYRKKNRERIALSKHNWYLKHKKEHLVKTKSWMKSHKTERRAIEKRWRLKHRDARNKYERERENKTKFNGLRDIRLNLDGFKCQLCGTTERLHVHHKRYGRDLVLGDLITLCMSCHMRLHHGKDSKEIKLWLRTVRI